WFATLTTALMAALALRLANSARVALLAALFTALHPLVLYYGQEARMYAQLTALAVLAGYLLVRLAGSDNPPRWLWPAFVVTATAAVYTHYFALFLLLGLAAAYLFDVWRWQPASLRRRKSVSLLTAGLAVLLLYTPWLAALFGQLRGDRSYWTGALKVQEALLDVALAFTGGESVLERIGVWLLVGYGLVTLLAIVRLWRGAEPGRRVLLYAALWLLAPVVAVLLLAVAVPKFNARYVMVALPGL
ncbi:MAG: glycosyltransferase family 39 protein, partial [Caldilinea sp.]|nr:glycosyltransferase family 39 protein [Caldilinea sp.]